MSADGYAGIAYSAASERNQQPILEQLQLWLPERGTILEIGSGTGQHAVYFSGHLTGLRWQPSDRDANLAGLKAQFSRAANPRILPPLKLDVLGDHWPAEEYAAAFSANTAHIMPWRAVEAMFAGLTGHLLKGAKFCLYGPFNVDGRFTSESNARFDMQLRAADPEMGIRDMAAVESLANAGDMVLEQRIPMPANNFLLVFVKG